MSDTPNVDSSPNTYTSSTIDYHTDTDTDTDTSDITCQGCLTNQPNQLAHMDEGGCLM